MFPFTYFAEVFWFCPMSRPRVILKFCLRPRLLCSHPLLPLPRGEEAAQLLLPETLVLQNQMVPVTSFWPLGGATQAAHLFAMPKGICSCGKGLLVFFFPPVLHL